MKITNFQDIPQLTQDGNYQVDQPLDYLVSSIKRYTEEYDFNMTPDFQRAHVWTQAQKISFVEHLLRGGKGSNIIRLNKPGWMGRRESGQLVVVDGKQRLQACLDFMENRIPVFESYYYEYRDRIRISNVTLRFHINNLESREEILRWYIEINTGGTQHTEEDIAKVQRLLDEEIGEKGG